VIPTFIIFLREGIEASMIVAILLAYLDKIGQRRHFRDIFMGVGTALVLVTVGGISAYLLISRYDGSRVQTIFETVTYLIAAVALTYMTFWMQRHSRTMSRDLQERSDAALDGHSRLGLGVLAFTTVGREGLETMVFTLAIVFASSKQSAAPSHSRWLLAGALSGLAVAMIIAFAIYRAGAKINLKRFFQVLGILLMVFAAGLLSDAVENLQSLGWLPFGQQQLWSSRGAISESSSFGDALHQLVGYADHPSLLQFVVWLGFLVICVTAYMTTARRSRPSTGAVTSPKTTERPHSVAG
jgi:high-affinity iron transporter